MGGGTSLPQLPGAAASSGSTSGAGGSHAAALSPVPASTSSTAPTASTRPAPTAHEPKLSNSVALPSKAARTFCGPAVGLASSISAATAAAWGAAAEVPQKRQKGAAKMAKKVVLPQSVAVRSGLPMISSGGPSGAAGVVPFDRAEAVDDGPPRRVRLRLGVGVEGHRRRPRSRRRSRCGRRSSARPRLRRSSAGTRWLPPRRRSRSGQLDPRFGFAQSAVDDELHGLAGAAFVGPAEHLDWHLGRFDVVFARLPATRMPLALSR